MTDAKPSLSDRLAPVSQALLWLGRLLALLARKTLIVAKRSPIAFYSLYRGLADADYNHTLTDLYMDRHSTVRQAHARTARHQAPVVALQEAPPDSALVLLGLFQEQGRFIDFLQEDVKAYSDQEIGAAARVVHEGCQRVLRAHLTIEPVRTETEGTPISLMKGFDPSLVRPTGNVVGEPPFTGSLVHRGWRAVEVRLPQVASSRDVRVLAAAEVEL